LCIVNVYCTSTHRGPVVDQTADVSRVRDPLAVLNNNLQPLFPCNDIPEVEVGGGFYICPIHRF